VALAVAAVTPAEFSAALVSIGWSQRQLAGRLKCDQKMASRWSSGAAAVPPSIATWLTQLATAHRLYPPPDDWRVYYEE
jgi:transcriptional regulator with XRE-family HTH domain